METKTDGLELGPLQLQSSLGNQPDGEHALAERNYILGLTDPLVGV